MLTLEQAITQYGQCENFCKYQGLIVSLEELNQITAWLRELQERRKEPEIIHCCECSSYGKSLSGKYMCLAHCTYPQPNHYCADGIRRTDEDIV